MAAYFVTLDQLGSFKTADNRFEAMCWTHRGGGWDVADFKTKRNWYAPNARTAKKLVQALRSGGNPYELDRVF